MIRSLSFPALPKFLSFKGLPEPFNRFVKPLLLASVGLHIAFMFAPIPSHTPKTTPKAVQPKTVKLAALPPIQSSSTPKTLKGLPKKPSSKSLFKPIVKAHKGLVIRGPNKKVLTPAAKVKAQTQERTQGKTQRQSEPQAAVNPPAVEPNVDPSNPMNDFPHYPQALPGCLGVQSCYETGKPLTVVAQYFSEQLPLKKFTVESAVNDSDRKIFKISKGGATQFLNILSEGKTAVYVLAEKALTLADLQQAVQIPSDFTETILAQLPSSASADGASAADVTPDLFTSPTDFYTNQGGADKDGSEMLPEANAEIETSKWVKGQTPQQLFDSHFTPFFGQMSYQASPVSTYGGGALYEVKKGTFKPFYLNLVPTKDGTGTIVVVWRSKPA